MRVRMFTLYHRVNFKFKHLPPLSGALPNGNTNRRLKLYRNQLRSAFAPATHAFRLPDRRKGMMNDALNLP